LQNRGIKVYIAENTNKNSKEGDERVRYLLNDTQPDIICLCGYLRLLSLESWMQSRVLNIHPSLLPKYGGIGMYGMRVHQAVLDNNEIESGCTVHYVDEKYDHGPHIIQRSCPVLHSDTAQDLADRVFNIECDAYPEAIRAVGSKLRV
jgi:phosphoribosylglycinamide formyltransferase-1